MFSPKASFSSFSVNDLVTTKKFYSEILGLQVDERGGDGVVLHLPGGGQVFTYPKPNHQPATFTVLNFQVDNIDEAVAELTKRGVKFEHYDANPKTDEHGIARGLAAGQGPDIAWFKDPSGNFVSVIQEK